MANPLAVELNKTLETKDPNVFSMLSQMGKNLFFPKGILSQSAEAKQKAKRINATIGIAKEAGEAMYLPAIMKGFAELTPDSVLPYAPSPGIPDLRKKWQEDLFRKNPSLQGKKISLPVVTNGVTHGLSLVSDLFVDPGDAVMLPDKTWGNYNMTFQTRRGAEMLKYPLLSDKGGFDVDGFRKAVLAESKRKKLVIILNFPHNPTGYSITPAEADGIAGALSEAASAGCNIVAVSDDAYFGLFYDDACLQESLFTRLAGLHERVLAVKLDGATKEDFVWGLRVAFMTFATVGQDAGVYEALEKKAGGAIRGNISNGSHASQRVVFQAMSDPKYQEQKKQKREILKARALKVREVLRQKKYDDAWTPYPFNAGYFMCLKMKSVDAEEFRVRLLDKYGIGTISIGKTDIRVAFSCVDEKEIAGMFDTMHECAKEMAS